MYQRRKIELSLTATVLLGCVTLALIFYSHHSLEHIIKEQQTFSENIQQANINIASGHLWLEEYLTNESSIDVTRINNYFKRSASLVGNTSRNKESELHEILSQDLNLLQSLIDQLTEASQKRLVNKEESGVGSTIDQKYDELFRQIQLTFDKIHKSASQHAQKEEQNQSIIFSIIVFLWLILVSVIVFFLRKDAVMRKKSREILLESEEKYRLLFSNMLNGFALHEIVLNQDKKPIDYIFLEVNNSFEGLTGLKRSEIVGKKVTEVLPGIEKEPFGWIEKYGKVALTGEAEKFEQYSEQLGKWFSVYAFQTKIYQFAVVFEDISNRKNLENAQKEHARHLEEKVEKEVGRRLEHEQLLIQQSKMAVMGEMIGAIAHQWRQPLNSLGLTIQEIGENFDYGELTKESLMKMIDDSMGKIQFMSDTIDDFRSFFQKSKEKIPFNVENAIRDSIKLIEVQLKDNFIGCSFESTTQGDICVFGYPNEFKQVLLNILSNGKDAILERKPTVYDNDGKIGNISIAMSSENNNVQIDIKDSGDGISTDNIDKVFDPYFTTKKDEQGTGIGLYMSKTIIERNMGGEITVKSEHDGTTFTITLVMLADEACSG